MDLNPKSSSSENSDKPTDTILIVEDEPLMLRLLDRFLSQHGYRTLLAADGEQAIEIYQRCKTSIRVVLLDMRLPKTSGEEVFRRLKDENAAVKVIIASGYLAADMKSTLAFAGAKRFVNKPYVLAELLETFQAVIEDE